MFYLSSTKTYKMTYTTYTHSHEFERVIKGRKHSFTIEYDETIHYYAGDYFTPPYTSIHSSVIDWSKSEVHVEVEADTWERLTAVKIAFLELTDTAILYIIYNER